MVPECLIVGVPVSAMMVRGGVSLVLRFKEIFGTGVRNMRREFCVHKLPCATLAMLIAISTFATQTWRAIVVPLPSLLKSTSMKCLCLSSRVFFFTLRSSRIRSVNSCCCQEERPSITWCTSLFLCNHCLCVIDIRLLINFAPHKSTEPLGLYW